jgi:hypothetical protein
VATIQIEHVPDHVYDNLGRRAASAGQSHQEYVLAILESEAGAPTLDEVLDRAASDSGGSFSLDEAATAVREERDRPTCTFELFEG